MRAKMSQNKRLELAISVVVPVYNNEKILPLTISALLEFLSRRFRRFELLFVDDGSRDASLVVLRDAAAGHRNIRVLTHDKNRGQQQAIATGMLAASNEIAVSIDADLPCALTSLEKLAMLAANEVELALGKRIIQERRVWWRRLGSKFGNRMFRILFPYAIEDSGCSTAAARRSLIERFRKLNPEVLLIKPQLLNLATNYIETEIDPPDMSNSDQSVYSICALAKLLWLMLLCRFQTVRISDSDQTM